jgi:hypothetical protein
MVTILGSNSGINPAEDGRGAKLLEIKRDRSTKGKLQTKFDDGSAYIGDFRLTLRGISYLK